MGCSLLALQRKLIQLFTGQVIFGADIFRCDAHMTTLKRVHQTIADHLIYQLAVTHAVAKASFLQQIGGTAHTLHATSNYYFRVTKPNRLRGQYDGFQTTPTDFIDSHRGNMNGQPGVDRCLTSGILAESCLKHIAHNHLVNLVWFEICPLQYCSNTSLA